MFLNRMDIDDAQIKAAHEVARPNLQAAVLTLARLQEWTDDNSDGWTSWHKPSQASTKLQEYVHTRYFSADRHNFKDADILTRDLRAAYAPIKSFLTRQGVEHSVIFVND